LIKVLRSTQHKMCHFRDVLSSHFSASSEETRPNTHTRTHTQSFYGTSAFFRDYPGEPVPER